MTRQTSWCAWAGASALVLLLCLIPVAPVTTAAAGRASQEPSAPACAVKWLDQREAIEQWLRVAPIERTEEIPIGVTRPTRIFFGGDGPARSAAWKPLMPNMYKGFWESYKSEIAAYELDRMLGLDMVPPNVERTIRGNRGAVVMWVEGVKGWDQKNPVVPRDSFSWTRQIVRMKMFDQLIANIDRNAGNLLYDSDYHIVLIDHSRAFTSLTDIRRMSAPTRIDAELWEKMEALTLPDLQAAMGKWLGRSELQSVLRRRDRMKNEIDKMVKERGERAVFIR